MILRILFLFGLVAIIFNGFCAGWCKNGYINVIFDYSVQSYLDEIHAARVTIYPGNIDFLKQHHGIDFMESGSSYLRLNKASHNFSDLSRAALCVNPNSKVILKPYVIQTESVNTYGPTSVIQFSDGINKKQLLLETNILNEKIK